MCIEEGGSGITMAQLSRQLDQDHFVLLFVGDFLHREFLIQLQKTLRAYMKQRMAKTQRSKACSKHVGIPTENRNIPAWKKM